MINPTCNEDCPFVRRGRCRPILPDGKKGGLLVVGEAPGKDEEKAGYGFAGAAGRNLDKALAEFGIGRTDYARTNAVWCRPKNRDGGNRKPSIEELTTCSVNMWNAIKEIQPKIILAVGESAARTLRVYPFADYKWMDFIQLKIKNIRECYGIVHPPVIACPHTSPLSWNMRYKGTPVKDIGRECIRLAVELLK